MGKGILVVVGSSNL